MSEKFYEEEFEYSPAQLRATSYTHTILGLLEIEDKFERQVKIAKLLKLIGYESYAFGVDRGHQDLLDKIMNINVTTERLYNTGLLNDGAAALREIKNE